MPGSSIERRRSDGASMKLKTENGEHGIVDKSPRSIPQRLIVSKTKETYKVVEKPVRLFQLKIKTQSLKQQILMVQNGIPPFPELLRLLVHEHIGIFLPDATARYNKLLHLPDILLDLCRQKQ